MLRPRRVWSLALALLALLLASPHTPVHAFITVESPLELNDHLERSKVTAVAFLLDGCAFCKEFVENEYGVLSEAIAATTEPDDVALLATHNETLAAAFNIDAFPSVLVFQGRVRRTYGGALRAGDLEKYLRRRLLPAHTTIAGDLPLLEKTISRLLAEPSGVLSHVLVHLGTPLSSHHSRVFEGLAETRSDALLSTAFVSFALSPEPIDLTLSDASATEAQTGLSRAIAAHAFVTGQPLVLTSCREPAQQAECLSGASYARMHEHAASGSPLLDLGSLADDLCCLGWNASLGEKTTAAELENWALANSAPLLDVIAPNVDRDAVDASMPLAIMYLPDAILLSGRSCTDSDEPDEEDFEAGDIPSDTAPSSVPMAVNCVSALLKRASSRDDTALSRDVKTAVELFASAALRFSFGDPSECNDCKELLNLGAESDCSDVCGHKRRLVFVFAPESSRPTTLPSPPPTRTANIEVTHYDRCMRFTLNDTHLTEESFAQFFTKFLDDDLPPTFVCPEHKHDHHRDHHHAPHFPQWVTVVFAAVFAPVLLKALLRSAATNAHIAAAVAAGLGWAMSTNLQLADGIVLIGTTGLVAVGIMHRFFPNVQPVLHAIVRRAIIFIPSLAILFPDATTQALHVVEHAAGTCNT